MSKKGLNYSELRMVRLLWGRSNETQKASIIAEGGIIQESPKETNPTQKEQSEVKIMKIMEDSHTKT